MTQTTAMPEVTGPSIAIIAQYIKDLSFENPNAPESLIGGWGQPDTNVQISMRHQPLRDDAFECAVHLRLEAKKKGESKVCFIVDLTYAAVVVLKNIGPDQQQAALMVEVPKLLFPFAREIIASATQKGGYPPLFLAPIHFETIYMNEMKRLQAEKAKSASA
jgi:preprotein translocase subunit SecB